MEKSDIRTLLADPAVRVHVRRTAWRTVRCLLGRADPALAEDGEQQTYLIVLTRGLPRYDPGRGLAYLTTVTWRTTARLVAREGRARTVTRAQGSALPGRSAEGAIYALLAGKLRAMPGRYREALVRAIRGMPYRVIARRLGSTEQAARLVVCRARRLLGPREQFEALLE